MEAYEVVCGVVGAFVALTVLVGLLDLLVNGRKR
jgi:hypothetical protein